MFIACEICALDEIQSTCARDKNATTIIGAEIRAKCYTVGVELREHLVDSHAKYVARALLEPNLADKTHFWILANVDYSAATISNEDDEKTVHLPPNSCASPLTEKPVMTLGSNSLKNSKRKATANKLSFRDIADGDDNRRQTAMPYNRFNINRSATILNDKSDKTITNQLADEDASEEQQTQSSSSDAPIESKAIRKTECQICKIQICSTARQRHVYMIHLRQKDLFQCSACDYTNSNSIWELQKHCASQHIEHTDGLSAKAVSNEEKHKHAIQAWNQRCFPDWKPKRLTSCFRDDSPSKNIYNKSIPTKFEQKLAEEYLTDENQRQRDDDANFADNSTIIGACLDEFLEKVQKLSDENGRIHRNSSDVHATTTNRSDVLKRKLPKQQNDFSSYKYSAGDVGAKSYGLEPKSSSDDESDVDAIENASTEKMCQTTISSPTRAFQIDWAQLAALADSAVNAAAKTKSTAVNVAAGAAIGASVSAKVLENTKLAAAQSKTTYKMTTPLVPSSSTPMSSNDRICHVCWEESRYPGRHIAQKHLSHHLYECPFGDGFGSYESCAVVKHIRKTHGPNPTTTTPMNNVEKLADEIMDLQMRCFPNRPMKLLRGYIAAERAICGEMKLSRREAKETSDETIS